MTIHAERDISYVLVPDGIQIGDGSSSCLSDFSRIEKLTIPDVYEEDNKKVISIGKYAFGKDDEYKCNIGELILSENLLIIDSYAFHNSTINKIVFPESLTTVSENAFDSAKFVNISYENCHGDIFDEGGYQYKWASFTNLILHNGIKEIPIGFIWGSTIQNFHIPASVVKINYAAFCFTYSFAKITSDSPNYVVHNGILYSSDCQSLIKYPSDCFLDILPTVTEISDCGGFSGLSHVNFVLKTRVRKFGYSAFGYALSMITCDLSCSVATEIPSNMFYRCQNLTKIIFPKTITTINDNILIYCDSLKSIVLPIKLRIIKGSLKAKYLQDVYYCGVNNINSGVEGNPNIHVSSNYQYNTFLGKQVTDKSFSCIDTNNPFFYDPVELFCTYRQVFYSGFLSYSFISVFILLYDTT